MTQPQTKPCKTCKQKLPINKFAITGKKIPGKERYRKSSCRSCVHQKDKTKPTYVMSRMLSFARMRCENPKNDSYARYGGRGIKFNIDRKDFYSKFKKKVDIMLKAGKTPSIDRIDSDGHYEMNNIQIVHFADNTDEMRQRLSERFKQDRILAEQAPTKICNACDQEFPTTTFWKKKEFPDGTVTRYNRCPECEAQFRTKYEGTPGYKGRVSTNHDSTRNFSSNSEIN